MFCSFPWLLCRICLELLGEEGGGVVVGAGARTGSPDCYCALFQGETGLPCLC